MLFTRTLKTVIIAAALQTGSAFAVTSFTETFNTDASGWLNGESSPGAVTYNATGGVDNSGYISYTAPLFTSSAGMGDPLKLMFRGNDAANASGDAFVGNWITGQIATFSVTVRHNYETSLNFYMRIAGSGGAGASVANVYEIEAGEWTTISFDITNSNPPFTSFGSSNFNGVFSNVLNLQIGLYLPGNVEFTGLRMDIDNVSVTAVPEPASAAALVGLCVGAAVIARRRRHVS